MDYTAFNEEPQPDHHRIEAPRPASASEVPVIDGCGLSARPEEMGQLAADIRGAASGLGFFYLRNHGIPESVVEGAFEASRRFFALPLAERMAIEKNAANRGYYPLGSLRRKGRMASLIDSFDMGIDFPPDHAHVRMGLPSAGANQWPRLEGFREPVQAYFDAVLELGMKLLVPLALSLDLAPEFFVQRYAVPRCSLRLLRYPTPLEMEGEWGIGARPHTDHGLLTLLAQDPAGGLELLKPDGEWIGAPYIPGTLVVNLGDLAARWTNDVYRSSPHRVVNRIRRDRYSIPFFFNPEHSTLIETLPGCVSAQRPARYEPVVAGEYTYAKLMKNRAEDDALAG